MTSAVPLMKRMKRVAAGLFSKDVLQARPVKFVAIGLLNTAFGYVIFAVLYFTSGNHQLSLIVATCIGVIFNFFTTGRIVFQNTNSGMIFRFAGGYILSLGANLVLLEMLVRFGINALSAQVICLPPIVVLTYFINARLVFRGSLLA
jgi:putative flippase GtrA